MYYCRVKSIEVLLIITICLYSLVCDMWYVYIYLCMDISDVPPRDIDVRLRY